MIYIIMLNVTAAIFLSSALTTFTQTYSIKKYGFKRRPRKKLTARFSKGKLAKNFYRMYKYLYLQTSSGARAEEMLKNLYRVINDRSIKKPLFQMSVVISHSNDVKVGLDYLRQIFKGEEGVMLISILENVAVSGLSNEAFLRLDHMLFQKYLTQLQRETKRIKKRYFVSVLCLTIAASSVVFLPLINQMMKSANIIFN